MTRDEESICSRQQELFELAQKRYADIRRFSEQFLGSSFCNNILDKPYATEQYMDIMNWLEFLEMEGCQIKTDILQKNRISYSAAGWLGYTYRHLHFTTGLSSKELSEKVPSNMLLTSYAGLHTVDEDMSIQLIIKNFKL